MGPCSDVRRQNLSWVTAVWFSAALSAAVEATVELRAPQEVSARCGANVTLTCEVNLTAQDIKMFSWVNKSCQYEDQLPRCESACKPPRCSLTLTLVNVMPGDMGEYLCKLRSSLGVNHTTSLVTVKDCFEPVAPSVNGTHASCCFRGVYPRGVVHWSRGGLNLTSSPSWDVQDPDGRYNVCSTVGVEKGNPSVPYQCSLWIHSRQVANHTVFAVGGQEPSRWVATLGGLLVVLEMLVLKLLT